MCVRGGDGDAHEIDCPRTYDHHITDGFARVRAIRKPEHHLDTKCDEGRLVERNAASEETRGKPQAKETHGEQQAAAPHQGQSANDWLWHFICAGS